MCVHNYSYAIAPVCFLFKDTPTTEIYTLSLHDALPISSDLGEHGAEAIHVALLEHALEKPPSVRTVGRVLERSGVLDGQRRIRRAAPPVGWYLPEVAARRAELDSFDTVSGLLLAGGIDVVVLNGISLHG